MKWIACAAWSLMMAATVSAQSPKALALKGKPLPAISLKLLGGGTASNATFKGKVILLDFWATWCRPCLAASPAVDRLNQKYRGAGLVTFGVNALEGTPGPNAAAGYRKKHNYSYTLAFDGDAAAAKLGIQSLPVFLVVDRKGIVREVLTGLPGGKVEALEKALDAAIRSALN